MSYILKFPDIGEGLEEGTILKWHVKPGDVVKKNDVLVNIETDKVTTDIPSPVEGIVLAIFGDEGDVVKVGGSLVEFDTNGGLGNPETDNTEEQKEVTKKTIEERLEEEEDGATVVGTIDVGSNEVLPASSELQEINNGKAQKETFSSIITATPVARKIAKDNNIDLMDIKGSGISGRIRKEDVIDFVKSMAPADQSISPEIFDSPINRIEYETLSQIRKTIAKNMIQSKHNAAHMSLFDECVICKLIELRKLYNDKYVKKGLKISYLPFILKATAIALKNNRVMNAELDMDNNRMIYKNYYNIGMAVDTPKGLMVPVIRDVDKLSVPEIAKQVNLLSEKARANKLDLKDMKDGTFTITNYGTIGGRFGVPIINYPEVGIMGVGAIYKKPVVINDEIVIGNTLPLSVSVDHRIIDGAGVVRFMNEIIYMLENPATMFI